MIAEHKVYKRKNGILQAVWEPVAEKVRNEALDLRVYNLAVFESLKDKINWRKISEQLGLLVDLPEEKTIKKTKKINKSRISQKMINTDIY